MACPYFQPVSPRTQTDRSRGAMLPLGDAWDGVCRAIPDAPWQPDEATLLRLCNMGYARGSCAHFPAGEAPDAARFTVSGAAGGSLRIYYVLERDHHPWSHGPLEFAADGDVGAGPAPGASTLRLARAYVESYRRRMSEGSRP